jgi:protoporphyrinogen oxidase
MGLTLALELSLEGHEVTIVEAGPRAGGLAGSFDFGGLPTEKFYHFICGADVVYFRWLKRLGLHGRLKWRRTNMAVFRDGSLHPFGDPMSLLRFAPLSFKSRLRYGLHVFEAKRQNDWAALEHVRAKDWLIDGAGEEAYRIIWQPLLEQKFGELTDEIAAAWIWSRIHRLASSRKRMFQEWLGVLDSGTDVLVRALSAAVADAGARVLCDTPVTQLHIDGGRAVGVRANDRDFAADVVLSTTPLPILTRWTSEFPETYVAAACDLNIIGVRCIVLKLSQPFTDFFWININDDDVPLCGIIEYTNLNPSRQFGGYHLVYFPLYVRSSHPEFGLSDEAVLQQTLQGMRQIRPGFDVASVVDYRVFREPYAQPICPIGFTRRLAPIRTPIRNLIAADTSHLLPHDRSISDSLALAERMLAVFHGSNFF